MITIKILNLLMDVLGWKTPKTILRLPEPLKIAVKIIHSDDNDNRKDMIPERIVGEKTALTVYGHTPDCKTDFTITCLLILVAWTVILGIAWLVRSLMKAKLKSKRMGQKKEKDVPLDLQACKADAFFDCLSNNEIEQIIDSDENIYFDSQSGEDFQNDLPEVFLDFESDQKEAVLTLDSQEKNEFLCLESEEKNEFIDLPSNEDSFPNLLSDEEERILNLQFKKKEFLNIPSDEKIIPSLPPDKKEKFLPLESEEKGLPCDEEGSPDLPSDEVEMLPNLESKMERFQDLSSDEDERFPSLDHENKDLPSDLPLNVKDSLDLSSDEVEMLLYLESKKDRFPDLSSDEEDRYPSLKYEEKDLPSEEEELPYLALVKPSLRCSKSKENFPDLLSDHEEIPKKFSDLTSDEQEILLYFKSKEVWFPDLPSDEERLPDSPSNKKLELKEELGDLPSNQEGFPDLPPNEAERFPPLESEDKKIAKFPPDEKRLLCSESKAQSFPVRSPVKRKASSTFGSTNQYSKR